MNTDPAFPTIFPALDPRSSGFSTEYGLTKREWFAGMALQGHMSIGDARTYLTGKESLEEWRSRIFLEDAKHCIRMADALIAELGKEKL